MTNDLTTGPWTSLPKYIVVGPKVLAKCLGSRNVEVRDAKKIRSSFFVEMTSKCQWVGFKRRCLPTSCRDCKDTSIDSLHHFLFILHCKNICNFHGITKFVSKELSSTKAKGNFYIFKTKREFSMWSLFFAEP